MSLFSVMLVKRKEPGNENDLQEGLKKLTKYKKCDIIRSNHQFQRLFFNKASFLKYEPGSVSDRLWHSVGTAENIGWNGLNALFNIAHNIIWSSYWGMHSCRDKSYSLHILSIWGSSLTSSLSALPCSAGVPQSQHLHGDKELLGDNR